MANDATDPARFLEEAVRRGLLRQADADSCQRILAVLTEVHVPLGVADVCMRKGWLDREQVTELKRAIARRRIGRYEVIERLGSGGTGVVWRARDTRLGRIVALKVLARPQDPTDVLSSYADRFEREARTAVTLNHVNIVRGLDYGEADGYVYFAMEFVAGETAADRVRREGRMRERDGVRVALQVVDALRYVRRFGLVHRDLKPENLLLTPTGETKVCDLGLAKPTLEEASRMKGHGVIAGTPLYMAPEQIRAPDEIDWRTDVYGLGATLYHLLTGRPPFAPRPGTSVIQRHLEEPVIDPREHVLELSAGVAAVTLKMLAKDPDRRYESLDDLAEDLSAVLDGRPPSHALRLESSQERVVTSVLAEASAAQIRRRSPRRRFATAVVAAVAVVAAGLGAYELAIRLARDPAPPRPVEEAVVPPEPVTLPADDSPAGRSSKPTPPRDPGAAALAAAEERAAEADATLRERIHDYEFVADEYAEHASGRTAALRAADLRARLGALADQDLAERREEADRLVAAGKYRQASELLDLGFEFQETAAYDAGLAQAEQVLRDGREAVASAFKDAELATLEWRFDNARAALERIDLADIPGYQARKSQVRLELQLAQRDHDEERAAAERDFLLLAGRALVASSHDHEIALRDVHAASRSEELRTYRAELEELAAWIPLADAARAALFEAWTGWADSGRRVSLRTAGAEPRSVVGRVTGVDGDRLLVGASGEAPTGVALNELRVDVMVDLLREAERDAALLASPRTLAGALLLALRRPTDAASVGTPELWGAGVRAVAVQEADQRIATARGGGRSTIEAREELDAVLADVPWYGPAYRARALLLEDLGDLDGAIADLEAALRNADRPGAERVELARLLERRDRFADAEAHLELFLDSEAARDDELAARARGALERVKQARTEKVVDALRRDVRKALRRRDPDEALPLLDKILSLAPDDPWALVESGKLLASRGAVFPAYRAFRRAADQALDDRLTLEAQKELAALERHRGAAPFGREELEKARVAREGGDLDTAIRRMRSACRRAPFLVDAHAALADGLLERGLATASRADLTGASDSASDALLLTDEFIAPRFVRARARLALGEATGALADADVVAARMPDPTDALIVAGRALLELGRLAEAYDRMQEAFENREFADPVYWQALILARQGSRREAKHRLDYLYDHLGGAPDHLREECEALYLELRD